MPAFAAVEALVRKRKGSLYTPDDVDPRQRAAIPSKEDFDVSPHYPLVMTPDPMSASDGQLFFGSPDVKQQLPMNGVGGPIEWETDLFVGRTWVHIRGIATTQKEKFEGKKRLFHIVTQGRHKVRCRAADSCIGQQKLKQVPLPAWAYQLILTTVAKTFSKTTHVDAEAEAPYFLNPAMAAYQLVNISLPGQEPDAWEAQEDCRLLTPALADKDGNPLSAEERRRWCDNPAHMEGLWFDPAHVYTYHSYQHIIDFSTYELNVGGLFRVPLLPISDAQPLAIMVKDIGLNVHGFSVLVWHKHLLYPEDDVDRERAAAAKKAAAAAASSSSKSSSSSTWGRLSNLVKGSSHAAA